MRGYHIGQALKRVGNVTLIISRDSEIMEKDIKFAKNHFDKVSILPLILNKKKGNNFTEYIKRNLSSGIQNYYELNCSVENKRLYLELSKSCDLIWFFGLKIPSALNQINYKKSFIDMDDIQSQIYLQKALSKKNCLNSIKLRIQAAIWKKKEIRITKKFAGVGVCSEADKKYLKSHRSIFVIKNGFERSGFNNERTRSFQNRIGFIGLLEYTPNIEGVNWFLEHVWNIILRECPRARFRVIGAGGDKIKIDGIRGVDILGYIKNPSDELDSWSLMIVPIFSGGGTRIKIAEAFSRKCPVVSTKIGAYGYNISDGREILIASSPEEFAKNCIYLLKNPNEGIRLAAAAWNKFLEEYTWESIYGQVEGAVASIVGGNSRKR